MTTDPAGALEITIASLRDEGRLTDAHAAHVATARALVAACEADPTNAALWREYRAALNGLFDLDRGADDDVARQFLVNVRTTLGHPPDQ